MKRFASFLTAMLLTALLLTCLTGCGGSPKEAAAYAPSAPAPTDYAKAESYNDYAYAEEAEYADYDMAKPTELGTAGYNSNGAVTVQPDIADKIIYTGYVNIETTAFDDALAQLKQTVSEYGGYVQNANVDGYTRRYDDGTVKVVNRNAYYTVCIPAAKYRSFMDMTGSIGNVTSTNESASNVTSQYTDYEARRDSLEIQEERLLDMLEKSGDLESLIKLEERLSEVRYEIEYIERSLRDLDRRISYSTVDVTLSEVEIYTPTVVVNRSFGEKIADAFEYGWEDFVYGLQEFCVAFIESLPTLILWAIIIVVVIVVIVRFRRKRKAKKEAKKAAKAAALQSQTEEKKEE